MGKVRLVSNAPEKLVGVPEAAKRLGSPERTVRYWCQRGWIKTTRTLGGHYRVSLAEIERIRSGTPLSAPPVPPS